MQKIIENCNGRKHNSTLIIFFLEIYSFCTFNESVGLSDSKSMIDTTLSDAAARSCPILG